MANIFARGTTCIVDTNTELYVRKMNVDGTLGTEYKLNVGNVFTIKQIDFYREGLIAESMSSKDEFFVPFSPALNTVTISKTKNNPVIDAICVYDVMNKEKKYDLSLTVVACILMLLFLAVGVVVGAFAVGI